MLSYHCDDWLPLKQLLIALSIALGRRRDQDRRQAKSVNYRTLGGYHLNLPKIEFTLSFFFNVLTIAFKLLLLISVFLEVRMFRLVEQPVIDLKGGEGMVLIRAIDWVMISPV